MKWMLAGLSTVLVVGLHADVPTSDACGVKLSVKTSKARKANKPVRTGDTRAPIATRRGQTPIAAGPDEAKPVRRVVAVKQEDAPQPAPEKATAPTKPKPEEKTVQVTTVTPPPPPPEKVVPPKVEIVTEPKTRIEDPAPQPRPRAVVAASALPREIYFKVSSTLANTGRLDPTVKWLKSNPDVVVVIEGHADPSGLPDANQVLSQSRADAVRDYFVAQGIDASRLEVNAYGDTRLRYGRTDPRNRRVLITPKK